MDNKENEAMVQEKNLVNNVMAYECGELNEEDTVKFFQHLINTGLAWTLQGHYGRTAMALIEDGLCVRKE